MKSVVSQRALTDNKHIRAAVWEQQRGFVTEEDVKHLSLQIALCIQK